jgi:glyoxylase-like metal-dependent hydrolase (beta-lactamase superfamily II)
VVESRGSRLIVLGDLVHWGAVQFRYPSAYTAFDADPKAATAERLRVFQMAASENDWVAGAHLSFPGIGHIRSGEGRYYWVPINYAIPR